jgi:hypothetical protein
MAFENRTGSEPANAYSAPIDPIRRLPEKATRAEAIGRERYVSTSPCFGKGKGCSFEDFMTAKTRV